MPNPFDDAVATVMGDAPYARDAAGSLAATAGLNPDAEAKARKLARQTGAPVPSVRNQPAEAEVHAKRWAAQNAETIQALRDAPRTAQWLTDPSNAAVARDDTSLLARFEQGISQSWIGRALGAKPRSAADRAADTMANRGAALAEAAPFVPRALGASAADLGVGVAGLGQLAGEATGLRGLTDLAKRRRAQWSQASEQLDPSSEVKSQFGKDIVSGIKSTTGSVAALGVTLATGSPVAGAGLLGLTTGGQSYGEARDAGLSVAGAAAKAGIDAAIETGTEVFPEHFLGQLARGAPFRQAFKHYVLGELVGEQAATIGQDFNQWAMIDANKGKSFDDYVAEIAPHAISTLTATLTTGALMTGTGSLYRAFDRASGRYDRRVEAAARAEQVRQHLEDVSKLAAASKLRELDPEGFHEFVAHAAEDGPVEAVYVDPARLGEVLNQSGLEPEQKAAAEAALAGPLAEAAQNGTDVRVPIEDFATHLAGTPAESQLLDHLKVEPDGMTREEAKQFMSERGDALKAEIEQALTEHAQDTEWQASADRVQTAIADQLHAVNRFSKDVNEAYATQQAAFYATMAARMGMTPEELYNRYPVRIQAQGTGELSQVEGKTGRGGRPILTLKGKEQDELAQRANYGPPSLRPAVRVGRKVYASVADHLSAISQIEDPVQRESAMRDADNRGYVDERGRYMDRYKAQGYAKDFGLISPDAPRWAHSSPELISENLLRYDLQLERGEYNQSDVFYSPLERAVQSSNQAKASGQQWLATLSKAAGVKKEELEWTGLPEWLGEQEGSVTREQVLAFVQAGGVQVEEVVLGSNGRISDEEIDELAERLSDEARDEYIANGTFEPEAWVEEEEDEDGNTVWRVGQNVYETEEEAQEAADEVNGEAESEAADAYVSDRWPEFRDEAELQLKEGNAEATRFEGYTEDGGEDYRELLLTLPEGAAGNPEDSYRHDGHFPEHPVVAHVRFKTRRTVDGKSVMFVEEVQSDWHQQGRDRGYRRKQTEQEKADFARVSAEWQDALAASDEAARAVLRAFGEDPTGMHIMAMRNQADDFSFKRGNAYENATPEQRAAADAFREADTRAEQLRAERLRLESIGYDGIPNAPFKTSWPALAMKRAIRWAVDNGIETIAWTTGKQQSERYNLSTATGDLTVLPQDDGTYHVSMNGNAAHRLSENGMGERLPRGQGLWSAGSGALRMTAEQVKQAFGADVAAKMAAGAAATKRSEEVSAELARLAAERDALGKQEGDALAAALASRDDTFEEKNTEYERIRALYLEAAGAYGRLENAHPEQFTLSGEDLNVGGEGMRAFYDRNLINITNDIIKRYGGKVKPVAVEGMGDQAPADPEEYMRLRIAASDIVKASLEPAGLPTVLNVYAGRGDAEFDRMYGATLAALEQQTAAYERSAQGAMSDYFAERAKQERARLDYLASNKEALRAAAAEVTKLVDASLAIPEQVTNPNPGFEITPELKAAAEQGFALFQQNRGAYSPATDTITLLKTADLSTFLHESGHFYLEMLDRMAAEAQAPQDVRDDFATILKWFGVESPEAWRKMTLEQKRPHHEKWASGFEAYLFTGKAPSLKLQPLFQRFRAWLIAVYRKAKTIGVQPTPAIRGVMDRMLATADEIAIAEQSRSMLPLFKTAQDAEADEHAWREYQRKAVEGTQDAITDLEARSLRDMKWLENAKSREIAKLKRQVRAIRAGVTKQVTAEVMAEPVYAAQTFLKSGLLNGEKVDGPHKLYTPEIRAQYGEEAAQLVEQLRGMTSTENGINPQQVAELFGFSSVDHMLVELTSAEPMKEKIAGMIEQRLLEEHGDLTDEQAISEAADKAIHNEARARFVATELAMLEKAAGKPKTLASAARIYAAEVVARLKVRNLKPSLYEAAGARAGKAAMEQLGKGNRTAAAAEKRNQLINVYAAKAAIAAKEEVEKSVAYFKRFLRPGAGKTIDPAYLEQILGLLDRVDLRTGQSLKAIDKRTSLAEWIEKQRELGFDPVIAPELLEQVGRRSYKDMTVEELRGLRDAIKNIEHLGRLKTRLLTAKRDRDFASAVGRLADGITGNAYKDVVEPIGAAGKWRKTKEAVWNFLTDHRKLASLAREMDGLRDGGPVWEFFIRPMNEAADREASMRADAAAKIAEIFKGLGKATKKVFYPAVGQSLSLEDRMGIALNMGNATNRQRVLEGEGWTPEQLDGVLSTLTADEWARVQQVWDFIGSYWPEISAKELRVSGVAPERVEAEPIKVTTADGQNLELPGGYYPIKYNSRRSARAEGHDLAEYAKQAMRGAYSASTTRRGHTKARIESTGMALRYDFGVITQHVSEVIHDLTHHEMLIDVTRLLRAGGVDGAIRAHYGPEVVSAFRKTIEAVAAGDIPARNQFEQAINYLRTGVTISGLGFNLFTSLLQPLGLTQSVARIGPKWVAKGIGRWLSDASSFENTAKWIAGQSQFMANRGLTQQREINEVRNRIGGGGKMDAVQGAFFYLIGKMQMVADIPTWLGQYEKSIAAGEDHDTAVAIADQAVLDSQGGGQHKDLANIQMGGPLMKLWTNFYSFFNVSYNQMAESINETRRVGKSRLPMLAADYLLLGFAPTVIQDVMRAALHGEPPDPEDVALDLLTWPLQLFVGLRDVAGIITSDGKQTSPSGIALKQIADLYKQGRQGELDEAFWRALNRTGGVLLHYPAGQVDRTVRGAHALAEGKTYNPLVLAFGPPPEKKAGAR